MAEPLNLFELLTAPQSNTTLMEGGQVGAFGGPANIRFSPALHKNTKTLVVSASFRFSTDGACNLELTALSSAVIGSLASLENMAVLSPAS